VIYTTQFSVAQSFLPARNNVAQAILPVRTDKIVCATLKETAKQYTIRGAKMTVAVDRATGALTVANAKGLPVICGGATPQVWRPFTGWNANYLKDDWGIYPLWKDLMPGNLKRVVENVCAWEQGNGVVGVNVRGVLQAGEKWIESEIKYRISGDGRITIDSRLVIPSIFEHVPRVGIGLVVAPGMETLKWFGCGPGENYSDRKHSTPLGAWTSTVTQQHFPFIPPSECGGHEDVRTLSLSAKDGRVLNVTADAPFHFDAHHSSIEDYTRAMHDHELPRHKETFLNLDYKHSCIGGNMGWSSNYTQNDLVPAECYRFRFEMALE